MYIISHHTTSSRGFSCTSYVRHTLRSFTHAPLSLPARSTPLIRRATPFPSLVSARREYAKLNFLKTLDLHRNKLSGVLPPEYASIGVHTTPGATLATLGNLNVDINHISGTLPPGYSALGQLADMWAGTNNISGTLPSSWSKLSLLQNLKMYGQRD